jgi:adenosylmethionine-8-amino-7-oxononanoate aminotransferase
MNASPDNPPDSVTLSARDLRVVWLLRPIGNVVYFMPPYIVDEAEMDLMVRVAAEAIELAPCD